MGRLGAATSASLDGVPENTPPVVARKGMARYEVAFVMCGQLLQLVMTFGTSMLIARMLNAGGYGLVNLLRTLFLTVATVAPLGLDVGLLKYCGRSRADDPVALKTIQMLRFLAAGVSLGLVALGVLLAWTPLLHIIYPYANFEHMFVVTMLALPFAADTAILGAVYRARGQASHFALMTQYLQSVSRVVLIVLAFFYSPTILTVVLINSFQTALSAAVLALHQHRQATAYGAPSANEADWRTKAWADAHALLGESAWMCLSIFVYNMMRLVDILFLGSYGDARSLGEYAAVSTVSQLIMFFPLAASQSLGPDISGFFHRGDRDGVRERLLTYVAQASIVSGFMFGGIAIFGQRLDLIFGKSFHFDPVVCLLLPLGQVLSATLAPTGFALSMTGHHRQENTILCVGCAILVGLCALLVPRYGQVGAASAVALSFIVVNTVRYGYVARILGFIPGTLRDLLPPLLALLLAWSTRQVGEALGGRTFPTTFLNCCVYTALFAGLSYGLFLPIESKAMVRRFLKRFTGG